MRVLLLSRTSYRGPIDSTAGLAHIAAEAGLITPEIENAVKGIAVLHNLAVYGGEENVTSAKAVEYLALVDSILYALSASEGSGDG